MERHMSNNSVIKNLIDLRNSNGYTQEKVADFLGINRFTYSSIESGKRDLTVKELEKLAMLYNMPVAELLDMPRNNEKFQQMYFYILKSFQETGIPKTKLAKLLYLIDFSCFYDTLKSMSGVRYVRREYGPVADVFFELTDDLYDKGKINIECLDYAFMIYSSSRDNDYNLLSDDEKKRIDIICNLWRDKRTQEIVNFTHEQKPWKMCKDGEFIPYELIIQEDPQHVYSPYS